MKRNVTRFIDAFFAALIITLIAAMGWLDDLDSKTQDYFYQKPSAKSNDVIVIGIDKLTVSTLGPISPEYRKYIADSITYLNNHDPDSRPAVIGLDLLFTGSYDYGNVVVAVEVDTDGEDDEDEYTWSKTWPYIPPYEALAKVTNVGHINAPAENVVHHDLLFVNAENRGRLYSLARVIYEKYCTIKNININLPLKVIQLDIIS